MEDRRAWDLKYKQITLENSIQLMEDVTYLKIARILRQYVSCSSRILEAGSGTGRILNFLAMTTGAFGCGLDYSMEANKLAQASRTLATNCVFVCGDLTNMPFSDNSFDVVFSDSVIEHLEDPEAALREMSRVARVGGLVVVTVPNRLRFDGWDLYKRLRKPPYLQRSFTPWHLKFLFENVGLKFRGFWGDTLFLPRNFQLLLRKFQKKTVEKHGERETAVPKRSLGVYRKLERLAEKFIPSYLWINIGIIGEKE